MSSEMTKRISRRRALQGGATALGGVSLALIGCGGSENTSTPAAGAKPGGSQTGATTAGSTPKRGGDLSIVATSDPPSLDPYLQSAGGTYEFVGPIYSKLV